MTNAFEPLSQGHFDRMMQDHNDALVRAYRFSQAFDEEVLLPLIADEFNARWGRLGFGARFVSNEVLDGTQRAWAVSSPLLHFWLWDDPQANDGKAQAEIRKEMACLLHDDLKDRSYDEQAWADFIEACIEEQASAGAELVALASNYDNVRVSVVGFGLREFNELEGPLLSDEDAQTMHYMGRLRLDLAIWTVPLA